LTDENYLNEIKKSYVYLPVTSQYSEVMISGVFFDTIENGGFPIIARHQVYDEFLNMNIGVDSNLLDFKKNYIHQNYNHIIEYYNSETLDTIKLISKI